MDLIHKEIITPNAYNKWNILFLDDKIENMIDVGDQLIPVNVVTQGIDEKLMHLIEIK